MTLLLTLLACSSGKPGASDTGDTSPTGAVEYGLPAPADGYSALFATSGECALCHANADDADAMRTADGDPIGMVDLWQATMMANAARDPLFWAVVSAEVARNPTAGEHIEDTCLTCHAPMARTQRAVDDAGPLLLDDLLEAGDDAMLGLDGVSCTLCHQVEAAGLGTEESWSGGYAINDDAEIYGPHADPHSHPMEMHVGYTPVEADHVRSSELCATCHTLLTDTLVDGVATGHRVPEQTPYLEWKASAFSSGSDPTLCQDCHMPTRDAAGREISTALATSPHGGDMGAIGPRSPYGQHVFVGGNAVMLGILRDNADVLQPRASGAAFDETIARTRDLLGRAASLQVLAAERSDGVADVTLQVVNLAGHKLPTGHPSRRAWVRLVATGEDGVVVFASGEVDAEGHLVDMAGAVLASEEAGGPVQPHVDRVEDDATVQIYQSLMADGDGQPTFALLEGASYAKDDRLLPTGWDPDPDYAALVAPAGTEDDGDFGPGGDQLSFRFPASGPLQLEASLLYQPVSPRYVAELATADTPEVRSFLAMWRAADRTPEVLAEVRVELP